MNEKRLTEIGALLTSAEKEMFKAIGDALAKENPSRDRGKCDAIFGTYYSHGFLRHCVRHGLESRAAIIGTKLSHAVVDLEKKLNTEFHKGALFHDTALAHFISGNEDQYEYMLAMADEEDFKTSGGSHKRGTLNLRANALTGQTLQDRLAVACDLLNGQVAGHAANYMFSTSAGATVSPAKLDAWRQTLDPLHQFEFLRFIHDIYVFLGIENPGYEAVKDNPFVMLRLAKALSHLAQWVESCLTHWQTGTAHDTLRVKLDTDPNFSANLRASATAEGATFPGNSPHGAAVDADLQALLAALAGATAGGARHWRLLRVLYIVRNSTAHTIEPNLAMYKNRVFLLNLIQAVFVSVFVICQLKGKPIPN